MQTEIAECFESLGDALKRAVDVLGGPKQVGPQLRPELKTEQAAGWLRDCLNPDRRERMTPEQFLLVLRLARKAGYHAVMDYVGIDCGYKATPVDPQSQEAELQGQFIAAVQQLAVLQKQMARVQAQTGPITAVRAVS